MDRLGDMVDLKPQVDEDQAHIDSVESEMNQIISNIDEINKLQSQTVDAPTEEAAAQAPTAENTKGDTDDDQVDQIIDEIEEKQAPAASPEEVSSALNAFTEDEITPLDENAPTISEIDEEPELEQGPRSRRKRPCLTTRPLCPLRIIFM